MIVDKLHSMRIDDTFSASTDLRSLQVERSPQAEVQGTRPQRTEQAGGDSASLSAIGVEVSRALAGESQESVARVERAQKAYEAGDSFGSAEEVAGALIASALDETALDSRLDALSQ